MAELETVSRPAGACAPPEPGRSRARGVPSRPSSWLILIGILLLAAAATLSAAEADTDTGQDLLALGHRIGADFLRLRWQYAVIVVVLGLSHYVAAAIAARASAGLPLELPETTLVQFAAAAANRLTPAGLGGSAVNARFFTRRGLTGREAVGAVAALGVIGALADLLVLALLVFGGRLVGLGGGAHELSQLWLKVYRLAAPLRSPWTWLVITVAVIGVLALRRYGRPPHREQARRFLAPGIDLARHPRRLASLVAASGSTTLVLALAFTASVAMVPGPAPQISVGALLVAYMAASAAGSAVPVPAGLGSTELAFIAVLVTAHVPAGHAVETVLIFRLVTFWFPAAVGVLATRHLRRTAAI